jgi:hypothetical protein
MVMLPKRSASIEYSLAWEASAAVQATARVEFGLMVATLGRPIRSSAKQQGLGRPGIE